MIVGIHHVAVSVPDLDRALGFYRDALGFEVVQQTRWNRDNPAADRAIGLARTAARMAMLKAPNAFVELWEYEHPTPENRVSRPCDFGYPHFALQVQDIEQEYRRLKELGMTFVGEPVDFGRSSAIYGRDPFGNVIELYEIRDPGIAQLER
ncbi:MAG TPA: VOC family protein [Pseudomonadales bacterium]